MAEERDEDKRPLWVLSADEQRVLLITFVGGLASVVIGAAMIGAAVAYAKWQAGKSPPGQLLPTVVAVAVALIIVYVLIRWVVQHPSLKWGLGILGTVLGGTALLWIVGVAAGIH